MAKARMLPSLSMASPTIPKPGKDSTEVPLHGLHQHAMEKMIVKDTTVAPKHKTINAPTYKTIPKP